MGLFGLLYDRLFKIHKPSAMFRERYKYVEQDTKCDLCEHKKECIKKNLLINSTVIADNREHYTKGFGVICDGKQARRL